MNWPSLINEGLYYWPVLSNPAGATRRSTAEPVIRAEMLCLVDCGTAHHRADDLDILDLLFVHGMKIVRQDDEVRQFARCDGSFDRFLTGVVGAIDRVNHQRLFQAYPLVRSPSFSIPTGSSHHALNSHQGRERPWTEVRTGSRHNSGINQS